MVSGGRISTRDWPCQWSRMMAGGGVCDPHMSRTARLAKRWPPHTHLPRADPHIDQRITSRVNHVPTAPCCCDMDPRRAVQSAVVCEMGWWVADSRGRQCQSVDGGGGPSAWLNQNKCKGNCPISLQGSTANDWINLIGASSVYTTVWSSPAAHQPLEHWAKKFLFLATWSCVSLPRSTTSSDRKCVLFVKFMFQHISVFKDWKHIFFLTTVYNTGAYNNTEYLL